IRAFYFRDPDGHALEILQFPPDKGDPRWHRPSDRVFLGIDHTAIVVGDTAASLGFYRDVLGMRVVGGSENHGPEQERLNNVFGARLRITTLRATAGPAVELLEYLTPRDGRPYPVDARATDLAHAPTNLATASLHPVDEQLKGSVSVRLDELELREVAAALAVPLDVVAVLDLVVPVQRGAPGGNDGVAEGSPVALDRQERVHRALQCDQRPGDVAVRRDLAEPRR